MHVTPRRATALAAAVLTAAAIGATAVALPASAAAPAAPGAPAARPAMKIIGGTLDWGVVKRYRDYVTGMAQGTITVSDGAKRNADGTFRFGSATGQYDTTTHVVTAAFTGGVTFKSTAHGFEVKLADFRFDSGKKQLTADVTKNGTTTQDVPLAAVAVTGPSLANLATTLTKEAAAQLGGPYEGIAGDPLTADLKFETPQPSPSPTVKPTPTKSPTPTAKPTPTKTPAPSPSTTPPAGGAQKIENGRLTWGLKESFRRYVQSAGTVTPSAGAAKNGEVFDFTAGTGTADPAARKLTAAFKGSLRFNYAAHGIDMKFGNIRVKTAGNKGTLVLDVKTAAGTKKNVSFATLDLTGTVYKPKRGVLTLKAVPAVFTANGAAVFANPTTGSMYKKGDKLDPVTLAVALKKNATLPTTGGTAGGSTTGGSTTGGSTTGGSTGGSVGGSTGGSVGGALAATGSDTAAGPLLAASGLIIGAGGAVVFAARARRAVRG